MDANVRLSRALTPTTDHPADPHGCWANEASDAAEIWAIRSRVRSELLPQEKLGQPRWAVR